MRMHHSKRNGVYGTRRATGIDRPLRWAAGSVLLAGLLAAGCSDSKSGSRGAPGSTVAAATSSSTAAPASNAATAPGASVANPAPAPFAITGPQPPAGQWFKGDLHSHSAPHSHDADQQGGDRPGVCFALAEHTGLDFLALTDHRTMEQVNDPTYRANTLTILDGEEWGSTVHMGFVGITSKVPEIDTSLGPATLNAQVQAAYDEAHRQGGIVIAYHPTRDKNVNVWHSNDFDAVEVWNAYWNFPFLYKDSTILDIDRKLDSLGLSGIGVDSNPELRAALSVRGGGASHQALKFWEEHLQRGRKKAVVGGGDRHMAVFPGSPTTHVFAEDQSKDKILDAIRLGRTYVGADRGPRVSYRADADGDGVFETIVGGSVPLHQQVTYEVRVENARDGRVDVVRNGRTTLQFVVASDDETFTWTDTASSLTWTRVDVFERVDWSVPQSSGFQLLALAGGVLGQSGFAGLTTIATPLGFQVSLGTRIPTIRLPREYERILNLDRMHWGYSRGAITSPIWAE